MGEGGCVYLPVNDCDANASRRGAYYGRVNSHTPLLHILYLVVICVAHYVGRVSILYCTIFTVCVTGLINTIPAIPYSYMHTVAVIYSYNHVTPLSIGRGYVV